jgi:hypothetical protein
MDDTRKPVNPEPSIRDDAKPAVEPRSNLAQAFSAHPVGSVVGGIAGLFLGALAGIAAGPIGSLFGAIAGLVLGLLLGTTVRSAAGGSADRITGRGR